MTASLRVTKPENMDPDTLIEWSKNAAAVAQSQCSEAEAYFNSMKRHYGNVTLLLERMQMVRDDAGRQEEEGEAEEIVCTLTEVVEAMDALRNEQFSDGASTLDDEERAILDTEDGQAADRQLAVEAQAFLKAYFHHKSRLGLRTQEDVERLTGISRRYISAIESGKHRPQFRTLKRLADAFGVDVTNIMGSAERKAR